MTNSDRQHVVYGPLPKTTGEAPTWYRPECSCPWCREHKRLNLEVIPCCAKCGEPTHSDGSTCERSEEGRYEAAIQTLEMEILKLREGVRLLEEENDRLKWELLSPKRRYMNPPVISFFGFQMESADVD